MNQALHYGIGGLLLLATTGLVGGWTQSAKHRLQNPEKDKPEVAYAAAADEGYCSGDLKKVLRRVLQSCGLLTSGEVRGCQPLEARSVATMSGGDFNLMFEPLKERAGIIQFDVNSATLDPQDIQLLEKLFADQRGASYFFVVARASPEGSEIHNRQLSESRGKAILDHLRNRFNDPDLDKEIGLLWLGEEFAQLDQEFCTWRRSGAPGEEGQVEAPAEKAPAAGAKTTGQEKTIPVADSKVPECSSKDLNRSAFVAWIDCRI